ncbi:hypothetical protein RAA17_14940 [Komagataeibacter rhaeticus]|nr:hypothetical protein [Komagataeibacter rhaeticus]
MTGHAGTDHPDGGTVAEACRRVARARWCWWWKMTWTSAAC